MNSLLEIVQLNMEHAEKLLNTRATANKCLLEVGHSLYSAALSFVKYFIRDRCTSYTDNMSLSELLDISKDIPDYETLRSYAPYLSSWEYNYARAINSGVSLSLIIEAQIALERVFNSYISR